MAADTMTPSLSQTLAYIKPTVSEIHHGRMHFLITNQPSIFSLDSFVKELQNNNVDIVVRVCKPSYPKEYIERHNISVVDWEFPDGAPPPQDIIDKWLELVREYFELSYDKCRKGSRDNGIFKMIRDRHFLHRSIKASTKPEIDRGTHIRGEPVRTIAVHCVAGLGRAPILVAIALMEAGMSCEDVVFLIRTNRRGALNEAQLKFLREYKPLGRLRKLRYSTETVADAKAHKSCALM